MTMMKRLMTSAGVLALSTGVAAAAPAVVQSDVNLRAGPGTQHQAIAAMPAGATVDVMGCQGRWCQVNFAGTPGFANRAYLGLGGVAVGAAGPAYREYDEDYVASEYGPAYSTGYPNYAYGGGSYYGDGYYGGGYYGTASAPRFREGREFRTESREGVGFAQSREGVGYRTESREGVGYRSGSREGVRVNTGVRERAGVSTRNTRSSQESATEIGGVNPMINAKGTTAGSAAASSPRTEVRGGANARGANVRGNASGGAKANATTGAAPRGGGEVRRPNATGGGAQY
jgi:hypothetical protein